MTLSIAIMAHPRRATHVAAMVVRLHDQGASPLVSWDHDGRGPWWNWQRAWKLGIGDHHLVLQDDVRFCADLPAVVERLIAVRQKQPISLFSPRESVVVAVRNKHRWVLQQNFLYAQALVLPRELGDRSIAWIEENNQSHWGTHDDYRLGKAFKALGVVAAIAVPNLVEHLDDTSLVSAVPDRIVVSRSYIGDDAKGCDINWSKPEHTFD